MPKFELDSNTNKKRCTECGLIMSGDVAHGACLEPKAVEASCGGYEWPAPGGWRN